MLIKKDQTLSWLPGVLVMVVEGVIVLNFKANYYWDPNVFPSKLNLLKIIVNMIIFN